MAATFYTWEEVRSQWVNGNLTDVKEFFSQCTKTRLYKILAQALESHFESVSGDTHSGDLQDLREIVYRLTKGE